MVGRVNIDDEHGLTAWAKTFHVAPEVLVQLVRQLGPSEERIRDALKRAEIGRSGGRQSPPGVG